MNGEALTVGSGNDVIEQLRSSDRTPTSSCIIQGGTIGTMREIHGGQKMT